MASAIVTLIAGERIAMSWSSRRGASAATGGRPPLRTWRASRRSIPALLAVVAIVTGVVAHMVVSLIEGWRDGGKELR